MSELLMRVSEALKWNSRRLNSFVAKVPLFHELDKFEIRVAERSDELRESFRLRHDIFYGELAGIRRLGGLDIDRFDMLCDHLIIVHKPTQKVVGTYRLNCSLFSNSFYSSKEFEMDELLRFPGPHLELGRACIHSDFRTGSVISLLWRGVADYMETTGAQLLFGCSSIKISSLEDAALVYKYLAFDRKALVDSPIFPTAKFRMKGLDELIRIDPSNIQENDRRKARALLPPLLKGYLRMGAKIAGPPAWDEEFQCIDFLTVVTRSEIGDDKIARFKSSVPTEKQMI
ncbi:MAG: GNAT family N-acetyltransferase [Bdellovibrionales bacterium]|nr:GNAT family N-acetyltransferase [Bdellovibrionales bacterium]